MTTQKQIEDLLKEIHPSEYVIAGEEAIQELIDFKGKEDTLYKAKGGSDFDISAILTTLSASVILIKNVIEIYQKFKPQRSEVTTSQVAKESKEILVNKGVKFDERILERIVILVVSKH